jgi:hypothetical protein
LFFIIFSAGLAHASLTPTVSVSAITGGTTSQVTVFGADPNASVLLDYPGTASVASINIGTTNASGYLTTVVDAATQSITSGASVYVMVDGQASASVTWPNYTNSSGSLPLNETSATLSPGQNTIVSAAVSAALSMSDNTNPSVATASISGNSITITGFNSGTTAITICASGLGCSVINVTVQSSSATASISLAEGTVSVSVGQSQTVGISGSGSYYISSNTNQAIASANINGSILTVGGVAAGSDIISICTSSNDTVTCASVTVNVSQSSTTIVNTTSTNLTFSQSSVNVSVGQSQAVAIYGGQGDYYVSNNQSPNSVTANVNGTNVDITGEVFGGDNITICGVNGQCGAFYVYVAPAGTTAATTATTNTLTAPAISSFAVSSNDNNGNFLGSGNTLTITFSANQSISIPRVTIDSTALTVNGSGNGPYTATYTMTGSETLPLSIAINFSNPAGSAGQVDFWVGNDAVAPTTSVSSATTIVSATGAVTANTTAGYTFTQYLYDGSTGSQVTALQERLTTDGIYSGPITGTFGPLTKAAVKAYQAKHGLDQLGVVGPATRALLNRGI